MNWIIRRPSALQGAHGGGYVVKLQWQKVKKEGMAPGPRMSFGLVVHKRRAIVFGGVTDAAGRGDRVYSELHNELYQFNLETRRWFPLGLRCGQLPQAKAQGHEVGAATGFPGLFADSAVMDIVYLCKVPDEPNAGMGLYGGG